MRGAVIAAYGLGGLGSSSSLWVQASEGRAAARERHLTLAALLVLLLVCCYSSPEADAVGPPNRGHLHREDTGP